MQSITRIRIELWTCLLGAMLFSFLFVYELIVCGYRCGRTWGTLAIAVLLRLAYKHFQMCLRCRRNYGSCRGC